MSKKSLNQHLLKSVFPIILIVLVIFAFYYFELNEYLTFDRLKADRGSLLKMAHDHRIMMPLLFLLLYTLTTLLCLPFSIFFMLTAGFLFSFPLSLLYSLIASTSGAFLIFLAANNAISTFVRKQSPRYVHALAQKIEKNIVNWLLFLRLIPLAPTWIVNLLPAFFSIRPLTYFWTTFAGSIPGAFIFTYAGQGLGEIFDTNQPVSIDIILNRKIKLALLCLASISLIPIFIRSFFHKNKKGKTR